MGNKIRKSAQEIMLERMEKTERIINPPIFRQLEKIQKQIYSPILQHMQKQAKYEQIGQHREQEINSNIISEYLKENLNSIENNIESNKLSMNKIIKEIKEYNWLISLICSIIIAIIGWNIKVKIDNNQFNEIKSTIEQNKNNLNIENLDYQINIKQTQIINNK